MRTQNSFKNVLSTIILNLIIGLLGFLKVQVFIKGLSTDIYSLNQLFYQIFGYINIADIGFSLILNKKLYDAFSKNNEEEIINIYSTSKKFYNRISLIMLLIAFLISFFIQFFTKAQVSPLYIQLIFLLFILRNVIDYFFIAPKCVLEADQKYYKINHLVKGIKIIEIIVEMLLVTLGCNYFIILIPGIFISLFMNILINKKIYKMYSYLKDNKKYNKKYLKGTKDVIYQKFAILVNSNTDIVMLSTIVNPLSVVIYTSYTYITKFITDTIYLVSSAITPSYANALNKENNERSFYIFTEINILFLFIASFISIMLYGFLNSLITLWVGKTYLVTSLTLFFFCLVSFQTVAERAFAITINSKGLFKETKAFVILETVLNFVISLVLIFKYQILGVLIGTVASKLITTTIFYPIYIYKNLFHQKSFKYFGIYGIVTLLTIILMLSFNYLNISISSFISLILYVIIYSLLIGVILFVIFNLLFTSFRNLTKRGFLLIRKNIK